jgi:hypothetical protein
LYTSLNPKELKVDLAEALRIPLAQQVIRGTFFLILLTLEDKSFNGILTLPFT